MIKSINVRDFCAVPYLETSQLMLANNGKLKFSLAKPNLLVGPNGTGKSALLTALSLRFLSNYSGVSSFDNNYVIGRESDAYWTKTRPWGGEHEFLKGIECVTDNGPSMYFRPGHIPGNENNIATAMMCGYFDEAKAYGRLVDEKSSGQQSQATLKRVQEFLSNPAQDFTFGYMNWQFGKKPVVLAAKRDIFSSNRYDEQAEVLKATFALKDDATTPIPLVLMDEPEQSLDARAEALLWSQITGADCSRVQLIVASHSLYPILHPKLFNLIETEPGYVKSVQAIFAGASKTL